MSDVAPAVKPTPFEEGAHCIPRLEGDELGPWPGQVRKLWPERDQALYVAPTGMKLLSLAELQERFTPIPSPLDEALAGTPGDPARFRLRMAAARLACLQHTQPRYHLALQPLPHQARTAAAFATQQGERRALYLADEVGMGKSVTAGLAALVTLERDPEAGGGGMLLLCPAPLVEQWVDELRELFGIRAVPARAEAAFSDTIVMSVDTLAKAVEEDPSRAQQYARPLVILDECHAIRQERKRLQGIERVLEQETVRGVLALSATPWAGEPIDFLAVIRLLRPDAFQAALRKLRLVRKWPDLTKPQARAMLRRLRCTALADSFVRHLRTDARDYQGRPIFPEHRAHPIRFRPSWRERRTLRRLDRYAERFCHPARRRSLRETAASSLEALRKDLLARLDAPSDPPKAKEEQALRRMLGKWPTRDRKLDKLVGLFRRECRRWWRRALIGRLLGRRDAPPEPCLVVFAERDATERHLEQALPERLGLEPGQVRRLGGRTGVRHEVLAKLGREVRVLICGRLAARGFNLQRANVLVNYDLPRNPAVLRQRIGRINRLGQVRATRSYDFVPRSTVAEQIYRDLQADKGAGWAGLDGTVPEDFDPVEAEGAWHEVTASARSARGLDSLGELAPHTELRAVERSIERFIDDTTSLEGKAALPPPREGKAYTHSGQLAAHNLNLEYLGLGHRALEPLIRQAASLETGPQSCTVQLRAPGLHTTRGCMFFYLVSTPDPESPDSVITTKLEVMTLSIDGEPAPSEIAQHFFEAAPERLENATGDHTHGSRSELETLATFAEQAIRERLEGTASQVEGQAAAGSAQLIGLCRFRNRPGVSGIARWCLSRLAGGFHSFSGSQERDQ